MRECRMQTNRDCRTQTSRECTTQTDRESERYKEMGRDTETLRETETGKNREQREGGKETDPGISKGGWADGTEMETERGGKTGEGIGNRSQGRGTWCRDGSSRDQGVCGEVGVCQQAVLTGREGGGQVGTRRRMTSLVGEESLSERERERGVPAGR